MGSTKTAHKPKKADLVPIDWEAIEPHFRAGILSYAQMATRFGVSGAGILKHFRALNITRDLKARIQAKAQEVVNASVVNATVNAATETETISANANLLANITLGQRYWSDKTRDLIGRLIDELNTTMDAPEVFGQVHALLAAGEDPDAAQLNALAKLVSSLPDRERTARGLVESMGRAILLQRRVYGMDSDQKSADDADSFESLRDEAQKMLGRLKP